MNRKAAINKLIKAGSVTGLVEDDMDIFSWLSDSEREHYIYVKYNFSRENVKVSFAGEDNDFDAGGPESVDSWRDVDNPSLEYFLQLMRRGDGNIKCRIDIKEAQRLIKSLKDDMEKGPLFPTGHWDRNVLRRTSENA